MRQSEDVPAPLSDEEALLAAQVGREILRSVRALEISSDAAARAVIQASIVVADMLLTEARQ